MTLADRMALMDLYGLRLGRRDLFHLGGTLSRQYAPRWERRALPEGDPKVLRDALMEGREAYRVARELERHPVRVGVG